MFINKYISLNILLFVVSFFQFSAVFGQSCFPNGIIFTSQIQVDSFLIKNPDCREILGDVEVRDDSSPIRNFQGLSNIRRIHGDFIIVSNPQLRSLQGLTNLQTIDGSFVLSSNTGLLNFSGAERLKTIGGGLDVQNNRSLVSFAGLDSLTHIFGNFQEGSTQQTISLGGLSNLVHVGGNLNLLYIDDYVGLEKLAFIGGNLFANVFTSSLNGLSGLQEIGGSLILRSNIDDISGLKILREIGRDLELIFTQVTTLKGLDSLSTVGGNFAIIGNSNLPNIDHFQNIEQIGGHFILSQTETLTEILGLNKLTEIGGSLRIGGHDVNGNENPALTHIQAFENLVHIGGSLNISRNKSLQTVNGFNSLESLGDSLYVFKNKALIDVLDFKQLASVGKSLIFKENPITHFLDFNSVVTIGEDLLFNRNTIIGFGFSSLKSVERDVLIDGIKQDSFHAFSNLSSIGGHLQITTSPITLHNLFPIVDTIRGNLIISNNSLSVGIQDFNDLKYIGGRVDIKENNIIASTASDQTMDAFNSLNYVHSHLQIDKNSNLLNLYGLHQLRTIGGGFSIESNASLKNIHCLRNVTRIGGTMVIRYNGSLEEFKIFENLLEVDGWFEIRSNAEATFTGFEKLSSVGSSFSLINHVLDVSNQFAALEYVGQSLTLSSLTGADTFDGFNSLVDIGGGLEIRNVRKTNFHGFQNLSSVANSIEIERGLMTTLSTFNNLTHLGESFRIQDMNTLTQLSGFNMLQEIGGSFLIDQNFYLETVSGFQNLTSVNGRFEITEVSSLLNLSGLSKLNSIGDNLRIRNCRKLTSIQTLENLTSIGGYLHVLGSGLSSLSGLQNIDPKTIKSNSTNSFALDLIIDDNEFLSTCQFANICEVLARDNVRVDIKFNEEGCNSEDELECENLAFGGQVFYDYDKNGVRDAYEGGVSSINVNIQPLAGERYPDANGIYSYYGEPNERYQIDLNIPNNWTITTDSLLYDFSFILGDSENSKKDFGVFNMNDVHDFSSNVSSNATRCNEHVIFFIRVQNTGSFLEDGEFTFTYDPLTQFISTSSTPIDVDTSNHLLTWKFDSIFPHEYQDVQVVFKMPSEQFLGRSISSNLKLFRDNSGTSELFSDFDYESELVCAYDPNDKIVSPVGTETERYTPYGSSLNYTIRFQNTGNATARDVYLIDTLPISLDISTLNVTNSSHLVETLIEEQVVSFSFSNIHLPDSSSDFVNSQGFVNFEIEPTPSLPDSTVIQNRAFIFFDGNQPIITDYAKNTMVKDNSSTGTILSVMEELSVFPIPSSDYIYVSYADAFLSSFFTVYDLLGNPLFRSEQRTIDISTLHNGTYLLGCQTKSGLIFKKFIKL